jgi:hypothetical protein
MKRRIPLFLAAAIVLPACLATGGGRRARMAHDGDGW